MASPEDPKSPNKDTDKEDAVSLQSNPPPDESPGSHEGQSPHPDADSSPPVERAEKVQGNERQPDDLKPTERVGNYRIEKRIGRGGMATVYRAFDETKQRVVALKVLKKKFSSSLKALARFDREFLALESLEHPNIVRVLDKGVEGGLNYFVMEYVDGASLSRLLRYKKLTFNTKAHILLQVASSLDYAHKIGIVHRDVKPDNVLIDRTGRAKLADFGIAQITGTNLPLSSLTVASSFMGTADYMAPEQRVDAKSVDHRADIFAFGVMLYETFTGKLPLGNFPLPTKVNPELSKRMDGIILKAMQQNPSERYQSIEELADDLKRDLHTSMFSKLKARLALILEIESWKRLVSIRSVGAISVLAMIVGGLLWMFSALGGSYPPLEDIPSNQTDAGSRVSIKGTVPPTSGTTSNQATGALGEMIFIQAGEFIMGTDSEFSNESPRRRVYLDSFYIDKYEVTNEEYKKFVDATGHRAPFVNEFWAAPYNWHNKTYPPAKGDHPVVLVSWHDAAAYAKWAGKRLPTEAEWEKSARGRDGRMWPWGDAWDPEACNTQDSFLNSTQSADMFSKGLSPYGCYNMSGNVTEWTADWYSEDYYKQAPYKNPPGPEDGTFKAARGGGWDSNLNLYARTGYRYYFSPRKQSSSIGFRCARTDK